MPIILEVFPSRFLRFYLLTVHVLAVLALLMLEFDLLWRGLALVFVMGSAVLLMRRHFDYGPCAVEYIAYADQQWQLTHDGEEILVELQSATVWSWLIVLNFRRQSDGRSLAIVLLPDSCSSEQTRQLRVLLRHFPVVA